MPQHQNKPVNRRTFIKTAASGATVAFSSRSASANPDKIRVGVVGCGGRGTGAAHNCVQAAKNIEIYAVADLFTDRIQSAMDAWQGNGPKKRLLEDALNVTPDRMFTGWDAYK